MARTITGTYSFGITLTSTASNPVTVTNNATITESNKSAIYGQYGGGSYGWTIANAGTVLGQSFGVQLGSGGRYVAASVVTNQSGGTIAAQSSSGVGIYVGNSPSALSAVTNQASATIEGGRAGVSLRGAGTVTNYGTITTNNNVSSYGVIFSAPGGVVINQAGGYIYGGKNGVVFGSVPGTLTNAGTIKSGTHAVFMYGGELIVDQGAVFEGGVLGGYEGCGGGAAGTLDLASATGISTLNATSFSYFSNITFSPGSEWLLVGTTGNTLSNAIYGTINGFTNSDTIELTSFAAGSHSFSNNSLTLTSGSSNATLNIVGDFSSSSFGVTTANGNSYVTLLCFARGTRIATPVGETSVEELAIGNPVRTLDGRDEPIVWIGTSRVHVTPGRRNATTPIVVHKGALGPGVPHADLRLTKGHSLYLDGVLIPVEELVNHRSIVWDDRSRELEIYHIELARHAVLLANGAPAESYRDDGNRWLFRNANERANALPMEPFAPVLTAGPVVDAIWRRLLDRAGSRPGLPVTAEPDLHVVVDGQRVDSSVNAAGVYRFNLPPRAKRVRVVSRAGVPAELGLARDERPLGIALHRIVLRQGTQERLIEAADPTLTEGFHDFEAANGLRWTNGDAVLPTALLDVLDGAVALELHVACTTRYPLLEDDAVSAVA
jgi:hypothetical protein